MTKAQFSTLTLAEGLFARAFALHPYEDLDKLIARCVEAASLYDDAIAKLDGPKPKAKKAA
jgi:hypothetical protein